MDSVLDRVVRRETHSPRSAATIIVLVVIALAAVYVGVEIVAHLVGAAPLLVAPGPALAWLTSMPSAQPPAAVIAGGVVLAIVGAVLVWLAVSPGRLSKHQLKVSPHAVVVDNEVIASAVAEQIRQELDLADDAVIVGISHRDAHVTLRPAPGRVVDADQVRSLTEDELARYQIAPPLRVRVKMPQRGDEGGER